MGGIGSEWHEDYEAMSEATRNFSRAVKSVIEELEAVDWYNQRLEATTDKQLRGILEHNRNEEIEHAMMGLEYLRRVNSVFDGLLFLLPFRLYHRLVFYLFPCGWLMI